MADAGSAAEASASTASVSHAGHAAARGRRAAISAFAVAALVAMLAPACSPPPPTRQLTLVARGMTFVLEDRPDAPNPVLVFRAGERVHLVLRNDAPGLLHDVEIPAFGVQLEQIRAGDSADVTFTVPETPGRHEYRCRPHAELMHGVVEVTR